MAKYYTLNEESLFDFFDFDTLDFSNKLTKLNNEYYLCNVYYVNETNTQSLCIQIPQFKFDTNIFHSHIETNHLHNVEHIIKIENNTHSYFHKWFELFEIKVKELIQQKSHKWFKNLSQDDVDFFYNNTQQNDEIYSTYKVFLNKKNSKSLYNQLDIHFFDENGNKVNEIDETIMERLNTNYCYGILEIKGILFSTESFHIVGNLKQIQITNQSIDTNEKEECLIQMKKQEISNENNDTTTLENKIHMYHNDESNETNEPNETIEEDREVETNEIQEVNILENIKHNDTIVLKKPNDVYKEIYNEIKKKAYEYKKKAIQSYLEAKHIKNTYLLSELNNSDDSQSDDDTHSDITDFSDLSIHSITDEITET